MPLTESFGVFPETVPKLSRQDMLQKLYFSTSSGEHAGAFGSAAESMDDVLNMGRKDGKYMRFRPSRAPLFGREFCTNSDYSEQPLEGHHANKMLAENFRPGGNVAVARPKLAMRSTFSESYVEYSRKQSRHAKVPIQRASGKTRMPGSASDSMLVTESFAQEQHKEPLNASGQPPSREREIWPRHYLQINPGSKGTYQSQYMSDFEVSRARPSTTYRPLSLPPDPGFPGLQTTCQADVWDKSRCVLLGPGR